MMGDTIPDGQRSIRSRGSNMSISFRLPKDKAGGEETGRGRADTVKSRASLNASQVKFRKILEADDTVPDMIHETKIA